MKLFLSARHFFYFSVSDLRGLAWTTRTNTLFEHTFVCFINHLFLHGFQSICISNSPMYALDNKFQPKTSSWMYLINTAITVHNKGNFEKVPGHNFFKLSLKIHTSIWFVYLKFYANHLFVVYAMRIINQQCKFLYCRLISSITWTTGKWLP